jgi:HK97 family phage prohead protease
MPTITAPMPSRLTPADAVSCLPRKTLDCEFKAIDGDTGTFELYALVFSNIDRQNDIIEPGAVQNVDELVSDGWIALNHVQEDLPIAYIDTAVQDTHGLKLTGRFHSTVDAQAARTTILERKAAGKAVKTSIGYLVPVDGERYEKINGQSVRIISKLSVYEASYVNLPANPEAAITQAKALVGAIEQMEESMSALRKKGQYKVDGEDMEKVNSAAQKCLTTAKALGVHHKAMKEAMDANGEASDELVKCMKNFTGGQQQAVDEDNDGDEADKDDEDEEKKDDEDTDEEGDPAGDESDKEDDEEDNKAAQSLRNHLLRQELLRQLG